MLKKMLLVSTILLAWTTGPARAAGPSDAVYPYLGIDWGGEVFVGAALPFGMVKVGPDMETFDGFHIGSGYAGTGRVLGFSHLHLSGASGKYGNILVAPVTGEVIPADIKSVRVDEVAKVGYYAATLTRYQTRVELTATPRVGLHRYTFLTGGDAHITVNLAAILNKGPGSESQKFLGAELKVISPTAIEGVGRYTGGWNEGGEYQVYFHMEVDHVPARVRTWAGGPPSPDATATVDGDQPIGASFDFNAQPGEVVQVKVGLSFVSAAQAHRTVEKEAPGWDFDAIRAQATAAWDRALSPIAVTGGSDDQRRQLYTALYHTMLMPSDRTGENPSWTSTEPYYDDYYTLWDTFRTSGPLLTLIAPERQRDLVRSLVDIYRHEGYLPDGRSGNDTGRTQGGSNAEVVIADAYVKGLTGIDYKTAYAGMRKDAEVPPQDPRKWGRGGLMEYNAKGYLSLANERSGSRTVEYAYDDFAIATLACGLGRREEAKLYAQRSGNWSNLWDPALVKEGVKGFLRPRNPDGSWAEPNTLKRGTWPDFFYEGDEWTYSLYAPHDVARLVALSGGKAGFLRRLDTLFLKRHFDMSNEPGFLLPLYYNWIGRPDRTADMTVYALEREFLGTHGGIPGNDDSGAMSSWLIFQMLGFFPVAGQDVYLISTPSFPEADLDLGEGKHFRVIAHNLDAERFNRYVQSATLNGQPLETNWFRHGQIKDGGVLELVMGPEPTRWGTGTPPPSLSDTTADRPMLCVPASQP
ncbi:GH92 family glycosyl hydrolase [Nitrospirillum pindoramense]|uniref:Putative alpha-1,2-mannosidase n=1 Tax=Nitrospirillum amazonense TaxID=28077 RepID=A0A560HAS1_9PROT|nr:GH92 family glycosyl hydrolase [Nitrospirillum amazonense]TWB43443.1 putative alpha-1,2-mannosidase [Nitrospirillum amazonense]